MSSATEVRAPAAPADTPATNTLLVPAAPTTVAARETSLPPKLKPRIRPPKDSKVYRAVLACIALRAQGKSYPEISQMLGYSEDTMKTYMARAAKRGWLTAANAPTHIEHQEVLVEKVLTNIGTVLDGGDISIARQQMTIEAAKGFGVFKQHQVVKGEQNVNASMRLEVDVRLPPSYEDRARVLPGTIGGTPSIDAEIIEEE